MDGGDSINHNRCYHLRVFNFFSIDEPALLKLFYMYQTKLYE